MTGITGLIGTAFNDTLNAGQRGRTSRSQGGLGTNTLTGTGAGDVMVEAISSSYTLTKTQLTGTGASFTDNLSGIKIAALTGVSATSNTFTVSGWTGTGSLTAPADTGIVVASKSRQLHVDQHVAVFRRRHVVELDWHHHRQSQRDERAATPSRDRLDRERIAGGSATGDW